MKVRIISENGVYKVYGIKDNRCVLETKSIILLFFAKHFNGWKT